MLTSSIENLRIGKISHHPNRDAISIIISINDSCHRRRRPNHRYCHLETIAPKSPQPRKENVIPIPDTLHRKPIPRFLLQREPTASKPSSRNCVPKSPDCRTSSSRPPPGTRRPGPSPYLLVFSIVHIFIRCVCCLSLRNDGQ